jgi:hypothetical protein
MSYYLEYTPVNFGVLARDGSWRGTLVGNMNPVGDTTGGKRTSL